MKLFIKLDLPAPGKPVTPIIGVVRSASLYSFKTNSIGFSLVST